MNRRLALGLFASALLLTTVVCGVAYAQRQPPSAGSWSASCTKCPRKVSGSGTISIKNGEPCNSFPNGQRCTGVMVLLISRP